MFTNKRNWFGVSTILSEILSKILDIPFKENVL